MEQDDEEEAGPPSPSDEAAKEKLGGAAGKKLVHKKGQPRFVELEAELSDEGGEGDAEDEDLDGEDGMLVGDALMHLFSHMTGPRVAYVMVGLHAFEAAPELVVHGWREVCLYTYQYGMWVTCYVGH